MKARPLWRRRAVGDSITNLQQLIKRWAEGRGYAVTVEKPILDGLGSVDVALEKGSRSIACEVSVTTDPEREVEAAAVALEADLLERERQLRAEVANARLV